MKDRHFLFSFISSSVLVGIGVVLTIFFGKNIPVSEILSILETLTNIASILLGVMGVWLSLIWGKNLQERKEGIRYIKRSLLTSFFIITMFLISRQCYPILVQLEFPLTIKVWLRAIFFFFSFELTLLTVFSVFLVILSFDFFSFEEDAKGQKRNEETERVEKQLALTQKVSDEDTK